jgi:hypothetical protein
VIREVGKEQVIGEERAADEEPAQRMQAVAPPLRQEAHHEEVEEERDRGEEGDARGERTRIGLLGQLESDRRAPHQAPELQVPRHPAPSAPALLGEMLPGEKSMPRAVLRISSEKSRMTEPPAAAGRYVQSDVPRVR